MRAGDIVNWGGYITSILLEYDDEYVYLSIGNDGAQLVHKSEISIVGLH